MRGRSGAYSIGSDPGTGGQITVVLKSGTNNVHGSAFECIASRPTTPVQQPTKCN